MPFESTELRKFTDAGRAISKAANVGFEEWATGEMGVVLKTWAAHTSVITPAKATIEARASAVKRAFGATNIKNNPFGISVNTGRRNGHPGEVWFRHPSKKFQQAGQIVNDSTFVPSWTHWKGAVWEKIRAGGEKYAGELAKLKPAALKAIGLARQSIVQSADVLGIALEAVKGGSISGGSISAARSAIASNGTRYQNGTGNRMAAGNTFSIEAVNRYPLNQKLKMDVTLQNVIQSRISYFNRNLSAGVFKEMKKVERAYPYLKVAA